MVLNWKRYLTVTVVVVAILTGAGLGFSAWLSAHDRAQRTQWETERRIQDLETANTQLTAEVADLKAKNAAIQAEADKQVADLQSARAHAVTPTQQVMYIRTNSPLHPELKEDGALPQLVLPASDAPILADLIADNQQLKVKLWASEAQRHNLETEVSKLETVVQHKDEEISLIKKSKNSTTSAKVKWLLRGVGVGVAIGVALL